MRQTIVSLTLAFVLLAFAQAQPLPHGVTEVRLDSTPVTPAVCLAGSGDAAAYAKASTELYSYLFSQKIPTSSIFFSTWEPGTEELKGADAKWEVCAEVAAKPVAELHSPYVFREVATQPAIRATCVMSSEKLGTCFEALIASAKQQNRIPATPPRFKFIGTEANPSYEVWVPLRPKAAAPPAATPVPNGEEQP